MGALKELSYEELSERYNGCKFTKTIESELRNTGLVYEVIDGLVCVKSKPSKHDIGKNVISKLLDIGLDHRGLDCEALVEPKLLRGKLWGNDFLIPDVIVINYDDCEFGDNGMILGIPKLAVEVMSSNREDDIVRKRLIYGKMGIPEYWIVDLDGYCVTQHVLKGDSYGNKSLVYNGGVVKHHVCGLEFSIDELIKELDKRLSRFKKNDMKITNLF